MPEASQGQMRREELLQARRDVVEQLEALNDPPIRDNIGRAFTSIRNEALVAKFRTILNEIDEELGELANAQRS